MVSAFNADETAAFPRPDLSCIVSIPIQETPMPAIALNAHFDGQRIQLDEPYPLAASTRLMVLIMPGDAERIDWQALASAGLERAYGADEPEYTLADLKPAE